MNVDDDDVSCCMQVGGFSCCYRFASHLRTLLYLSLVALYHTLRGRFIGREGAKEGGHTQLQGWQATDTLLLLYSYILTTRRV